MSLFFAELRKVWGGRVFPALLAILAASNLLLLWMGTRPTAKQPPASAYRAVGVELSDKNMEEKGAYLHNKYTEIESLVKIGQYYRELAYGGYGLTQYRQDNAAMFDAYEQEYTDKTYTLFTDNLNTEYRLFSQLQSEYDTVAAYSDFLDGVQTKASQLSGISIFQNDRTGYDLKNHRINRTGLCRANGDTHRLLPTERSVHSHQLCVHRPYPAGIYALACVDSCAPRARQRLVEFDSQSSRWAAENGHCKAGGICCQLIGRSDGAVWGQPRILLSVVQFGAYESHDSKCSRH